MTEEDLKISELGAYTNNSMNREGLKKLVEKVNSGGGGTVDAYTKAETDALLEDKADADGVYTKAETDALLDDKQDVLTAGTNITIENNVISASGGGSSNAWEFVKNHSSGPFSIFNQDLTYEYMLVTTDDKYKSIFSSDVNFSGVCVGVPVITSETQDGIEDEFSIIDNNGWRILRKYTTSNSNTADATKWVFRDLNGNVITSTDLSTFFDSDNKTVIKPFYATFKVTSGSNTETFSVLVEVGNNYYVSIMGYNLIGGVTLRRYSITTENIYKLINGSSVTYTYASSGSNYYNVSSYKIYKRKKLIF